MNGDNIGITQEVLDKINVHSVSELKAEQVFCFRVLLCDNEVDRDHEKFTRKSLEKLAELFVGRTGIFDHDNRSGGQTARIYDTQVVDYPDKTTADGEVYSALMGYAYMVRTEQNKALIAEIEGGIKKEVSVGCSVKKRICSICGSDGAKNGCTHIKGRTYGDRLCFVKLEEPTDAYEWSFVAVPAQRAAGVTKVYAEGSDEDHEKTALRKMADAASSELRADIIRLGCFGGGDTADADGLDIYGLIRMKHELEARVRKKNRGGIIKVGKADASNDQFKM